MDELPVTSFHLALVVKPVTVVLVGFPRCRLSTVNNIATLASQVILHRCVPQGWAARITFDFVLYSAFFPSSILTILPIYPYSLWRSIRYVLATSGKEKEKLDTIPSVRHLALSVVVWLMDYPFDFSAFNGIVDMIDER